MAHNERDRLRKALDAMIFLPHLKEKHTELSSLLFPSSFSAEEEKSLSAPSSLTDATRGVRPWDRRDLYRRLQTFRASTWFSKPAKIGPVECARRGWENTDVDELTCERCKARLSCPIAPQLLPNEADVAAEKWANKLIDAHEVSCPWRSSSSPLSLLRFPELPQNTVALDFGERCRAMQRLACIPPLATETIEMLSTGPQSKWIAEILSNYQHLSGEGLTMDGGFQGAAAAVRHALQESQNQKVTSALELDRDDSVAASSNFPSTALNANERNKLKSLLSVGVVGSDNQGYLPRIRALALCGWTIRPLVASSSTGRSCDKSSTMALPRTPDQTVSAMGGIDLLPECTILVCTLCGAKVGMWNSFIGMEPSPSEMGVPSLLSSVADAEPGPSQEQHHQVHDHHLIRPASTTKAEHRQRSRIVPTMDATRRRASTGSSFGTNAYRVYPNLLPGQVFVDMSTTIAGGTLDDVGGKTARAKDASEDPTSDQRACWESETSASPVFGIEALRWQDKNEKKGLSSRQEDADTSFADAMDVRRKRKWGSEEAAEPRAAKRLDSEVSKEKLSHVVVEQEVGMSTPTPSSAKTTGERSSQEIRFGDSSVGRKSVSSKISLQRYQNMETVPLDLFNLHRSFCPWVHAPSTVMQVPSGTSSAGDMNSSAVPCGWTWYAQQLRGDINQALNCSFSQGAIDETSDEWDPAGLLKRVLSKMPIKK